MGTEIKGRNAEAVVVSSSAAATQHDRYRPKIITGAHQLLLQLQLLLDARKHQVLYRD